MQLKGSKDSCTESSDAVLVGPANNNNNNNNNVKPVGGGGVHPVVKLNEQSAGQL